ncbi:MAG TPA: transcription antitermination factor NusB [Thermoleophilaceae bacterium]|nr:transcription antitermination factor NusB [Thermoleophilaceae bacterium]
MRRSDQRRAAVFALYQHEITGRAAAELLDRRAPTFARELVEGVEETRAQLDATIERHSIGWALDRIAPLERSILRVALYELGHRPDVPSEVVIDQAVESAKELCAVEAAGFVNGVLAAAHRAAEEAPAG